MAQEAEDQAAGDAQLLLAIFERGGDAVESPLQTARHGRCGFAGRRRVRVDHVLRFAAQQVGPGQVVEILGGAQYIGALVIQVEKLLQVVEGVGLAQGVDVVPCSAILLRSARANSSSGSSEPSRCRCSSALGRGVEPIVHV